MLVKNTYGVPSRVPAVYRKAFALKLVPVMVPKIGCLDK